MADLNIDRIINLLDHDVVVEVEGRQPITVRPCIYPEHALRIEIIDPPIGEFLGIPLRGRRRYGRMKAGYLPPPTPGMIYIVPQYVCQAFPDRDDLAYPDGKVYDDDGRIIACRWLRLNNR